MTGNRWKLSPTPVVCSTALLVIALSFAAGYVGSGAKTVDPRVTLDSASPLIEAKSPAKPPQTTVVSVMEGEVARTADRIAEATALALSASLYAATEQLKGRAPRSVRDLVAGLAAANLLPPGLQLTQAEGTLAAPRGTLSVRYRPAPLGVEIVALGREPADGPALIVRVPDENAEKGEARLFLANRLREVNVPAPFAPAAEVIAAGWSPEPLRSAR